MKRIIAATLAALVVGCGHPKSDKSDQGATKPDQVQREFYDALVALDTDFKNHDVTPNFDKDMKTADECYKNWKVAHDKSGAPDLDVSLANAYNDLSMAQSLRPSTDKAMFNQRMDSADKSLAKAKLAMDSGT